MFIHYLFCISFIPPLSLPSLLSPEVTLPVIIIAITTTHSYPHYSHVSSVLLLSFIHYLLSCASFITPFRLFSFLPPQVTICQYYHHHNESFLSTQAFPVLLFSTLSYSTSFLVLLSSQSSFSCQVSFICHFTCLAPSPPHLSSHTCDLLPLPRVSFRLSAQS